MLKIVVKGYIAYVEAVKFCWRQFHKKYSVTI